MTFMSAKLLFVSNKSRGMRKKVGIDDAIPAVDYWS
jgi:hypothetical protein